MKTVSGSELRRLLATKGHRAWVEMTLQYGKTFRSGGLVLTCEPDAVRALLMEKVHTTERSRLHKVLANVPGASGILFLDGEPWLRRIKAVMPAFHRDHVDGFIASLRDLTLQHAQQWSERGRMPDLFDAVQRLGAASVLKMGYGLDPEHSLAKQLGQALVDYKQASMIPDPRCRVDVFAAGAGRILHLPWLAGAMLGLRQKMGRVREVVKALTLDSTSRLKQPGWMTDLVESGFSEVELANEINHLYGAFNAIDYVVTAALYELARRRELTIAIRNELQAVLGSRALPQREDLPQLPITRGFMLEILRIYPVSMGIARRVGAPMKLADEEVPTGTEVLILLHAVHHHPDFWDQPNRLLPERWANSDAPRVPYSYAPFLDGPRKCIGRSMAEMQLLVILSTLVRHYDLGVYAEARIPTMMVPRFSGALPFVLQSPLPS